MTIRGPLSHLKLIEMAGLGPCPLAGQLIADLGAEVIVIDRASGPRNHAEINRRNKKSIALNLKLDSGRDAALRLIDHSDILIEGYRPGVMEKLGLGPDCCHARNPGLVFGRMTGWGQAGPLSAQAGHDINYLSLTGALAAMGSKNGVPMPPLNLVADYGGGAMFLVFGVLSALLEKNKSGFGQVVDTAIVDCVPAMMGAFFQMMHSGHWDVQRESNLLDGGAPFYRCYETLDGKWISIGAIEPHFFAELCHKAGLEHVGPMEQNDKTHWTRLAENYAKVFRTRSRDDWAEIFSKSDACATPVLNLEEVETHPHNLYRGTYFRKDGVLQSRPAPRFDRTPAGPVNEPSAPGADSEEILENAGFSREEIFRMRSNGILT